MCQLQGLTTPSLTTPRPAGLKAHNKNWIYPEKWTVYLEVENHKMRNFKPGYYKITSLVEPNVIEIENTWFIKLKGVGDNTELEELKKWLKEGYIVRVIPYQRNNAARIISDVWLGNTHINRQFLSYNNQAREEHII